MKFRTLLTSVVLSLISTTNTFATTNSQSMFSDKFCGASGCKNSFKALRELAKNGSPQAKMITGLMYMTGTGTDKDEQRAARNLLSAARSGSEIAQYAVGVLYIQGEVLEQDLEEGNRWITKSAERGYEPALKLINGKGSDEEHKAEKQDDGHLVIEGDLFTLEDYADYIKKNTPYGKRSSTGSRIRGIHCGESASKCDRVIAATPEGTHFLIRKMMGKW